MRFLEGLFLQLYPAALRLELIVVVISVLMSCKCHESSEADAYSVLFRSLVARSPEVGPTLAIT